MPIADLPSNLQVAIQEGYLDREFGQPLEATLGYRNIAEKEFYNNNIGETVTRTRGGLLQTVTDPLDPATNTNLDNGLTPQYWSVEQYVMTLNEYASTMDLNVVTQNVAIAQQFLQNAKKLGEQAQRSLDEISRNFLFGADPAIQLNGAYMAGNTRVTQTLGAPADTIAVDDIRGFVYTIPTSGANAGRPNISTSPTNTQDVQVGNGVYTLIGAAADVVNISSAASVGGISGTLTFSTNVSVANGTTGNSVISAVGSTIVRPNGKTNTSSLLSSDLLTLQTCRNAVLALQNNAVDGPYTFIIPPASWSQLYQDSEFQLLFRGTEFNSREYRNYIPSSPMLGFDIVVVNTAPSQTLGGLNIKRPIMCGQGCLIEADFEGANEVLSNKYGGDLHDVTVQNGVYHVTRGQIDRLKQIIAQSWFYIGGWTAPTDQTTNSSTVPTATSAYYKRAVVIETA